MLIRSLLIVSVFLMAYSCKKEPSGFDREEALDKDTATIIYSLNYLGHTPTSFQFNIELLTLNELESEQSYSGLQYAPNNSNQDFSYNITSESVLQPSFSDEYSTVILLDLSNGEFLDREYVGVYLRRYFELVDSLPLRHVAFSSFSSAENHESRFHSENPSDIFGNSWEFNTSTFYKLRQTASEGGSSVSMLFFKRRIMDAMDSLVAANPLGDLSITTILGVGGINNEDQSDYLEIITKANSNNIKLNIISDHSYGDFQCLSSSTGGFFSSYPILDQGQNSEWIDSLGSATKASILNLDDLLRSEVNVHRITIQVTASNGATFQQGQYFSEEFTYAGLTRRINFIIP